MNMNSGNYKFSFCADTTRLYRKDLQVIAEETQEGLIDGESCPIHSVNVPYENFFLLNSIKTLLL
jgi:hypothetical protein